MADATTPGPPMGRLGLDEFWDNYADQELLTFKRDPTSGYSGTCLSDGAESSPLSDEGHKFSFERGELLRYGYRTNRMFDLGIYDDLAEALAILVAMPLMETESIPNRDQLELVFRLLDQTPPEWDTAYSALHGQALAALENGKITLEKAAALMDRLKPGDEDYKSYEGTGMVALLSAEREILLKAYAFCTSDPQITKQITAVIDNHEHEDVITVQTAIWALGRHNDNAAIDSLVGLLRRDAFGFHRITIQDALQFLCSGRELVPTADENEWKYWSEYKQRLPNNPAAWATYDAESVFWEKRLRVAREWKAAGQESRLERLKMDEVLPVRLAAGGPEKLTA